MKIFILEAAKCFIDTFPLEKRHVFAAPISALAANETKRLTIKTLSGKVREVVLNENRIVYFISGDALFVIDIFKKKSQKTPKRIIERAERIYEKIKQTYG